MFNLKLIRQKGEVASILALSTFVVMLVGLIVGVNVTKKIASTSSFAVSGANDTNYKCVGCRVQPKVPPTFDGNSVSGQICFSTGISSGSTEGMVVITKGKFLSRGKNIGFQKLPIPFGPMDMPKCTDTNTPKSAEFTVTLKSGISWDSSYCQEDIYLTYLTSKGISIEAKDFAKIDLKDCPDSPPTPTPSPTPRGSSNFTPTPTPTGPTRTPTPSPSATNTPGGPTDTITLTPTETLTPTFTDTPTHTPTSTETPTNTPTHTPTITPKPVAFKVKMVVDNVPKLGATYQFDKAILWLCQDKPGEANCSQFEYTSYLKGGCKDQKCEYTKDHTIPFTTDKASFIYLEIKAPAPAECKGNTQIASNIFSRTGKPDAICEGVQKAIYRNESCLLGRTSCPNEEKNFSNQPGFIFGETISDEGIAKNTVTLFTDLSEAAESLPVTPTPTPTNTPTNTLTPTNTPTDTLTPTPRDTDTPTPTETFTPTPTSEVVKYVSGNIHVESSNIWEKHEVYIYRDIANKTPNLVEKISPTFSGNIGSFKSKTLVDNTVCQGSIPCDRYMIFVKSYYIPDVGSRARKPLDSETRYFTIPKYLTSTDFSIVAPDAQEVGPSRFRGKVLLSGIENLPEGITTINKIYIRPFFYIGNSKFNIKPIEFSNINTANTTEIAFDREVKKEDFPQTIIDNLDREVLKLSDFKYTISAQAVLQASRGLIDAGFSEDLHYRTDMTIDLPLNTPALIASLSLQNNSSKTVEGFDLIICLKGSCSKYPQNQTSSAGQSISAQWPKGIDTKQKYDVSCEVAFDDKSKFKCPSQILSPADPIRLTFNISSTGITSTISDKRELCDLDQKGSVNSLDATQLLNDWKSGNDKSASDINGDGKVDSLDFSTCFDFLGEIIDDPNSISPTITISKAPLISAASPLN